MPLKNLKINKLIFLSVIAVVLVLAPVHFAQADGGFSLFSLDSISETFVSKLAYIFFTLIGNGINALVKVLNSVLHMAIYSDSVNAPVVYQSWTIMRDFANMFFIIALIVMAFATIFDIAQYSAKALIGKFLIAALLINFSLTLGGLVIDGAQVLNNTFLTAIGDSALRLGQAVNPVKLLPEGATAATASSSAMAGGTLLFNLVLGLILGGVFLVSILIATLFALIRIPMVWFLLIVSPLAWIASVFPQGDGYFKNWWKQFVGWNLFLPVFLFFLYFGLYFITNIGNITGAISQGYDKEKIGLAQVTFETLFAYVLAAIFMIGGVITAFKVSFLSGTGAIKAASWAKGTAMSALGRYTGIAALGKGAKMRLEQIQKEGLQGRIGQKLYGGQAGEERKAAWVAEKFGFRGMELQRQKDFVGRADKAYELVQQQYNTGKIDAAGIVARAKQFKANDPQSYAFLKMAAKMGKLDDEIFTKAITELGNNPYAMQDFVKTAKESKFSKISPEIIKDAAMGTGKFQNLGSSAVGARREIWTHIADGPGAAKLTYQEFKQGLEMLGGAGSGDGKSYLENVGKYRPDLVMQNKINEYVAKYKKDNPAASPEDLKKAELEQRKIEFGKSFKGITELSKFSTEVWNNKQFQQALSERLAGGKPEARNKFVADLENSLKFDPDYAKKSEILNSIVDKINAQPSKTASQPTGKQGNIVLTPGAQFEQENPEKVNVVDLRNK